MRVDVHRFATDESDQREPSLLGQFGCQRAGSRDRSQYRNTGEYRLLGELEGGASRDGQDHLAQREQLPFDGPADDFIHGVVPPDIFTYAAHLRVEAEQTCCMEAAGAVKCSLLLSQPRAQAEKPRFSSSTSSG